MKIDTCKLRLKGFSATFLHRCARLSRRTYVAVFWKKQLRKC